MEGHLLGNQLDAHPRARILGERLARPSSEPGQPPLIGSENARFVIAITSLL